ncbi:MAG: radical SAM protein [Clostridia bacterium]|nr:radical SAM protein [Clostridia bacterium]
MKNKPCTLCPRACGTDRSKSLSYCGVPDSILIARAALHMWEEPPISGERGSGTIFFCGCNMGCVFCQNRKISRPRKDMGRVFDEDGLWKIMLALREKGAHNINLVTPTHYADSIAQVLRTHKGELGIPVVYNCGGYESVETLRSLEGLVDIYLPDFKYFSSELSKKYSNAPDYMQVASAALDEMLRQQKKCAFDDKGIMQKGVIVRHLVLPGCRKDSIEVLRKIAEIRGDRDLLISIMRQFTPDFLPGGDKFSSLRRRLTSFEYESVLKVADELGLEGFSQGADSASSDFTPNFSENFIEN